MTVTTDVWINRTSAPANGRLLLVCLNDAFSIADVNARVFFTRASDEKKSDDSSSISLLLYEILEKW
jgi:hypothetical protein